MSFSPTPTKEQKSPSKPSSEIRSRKYDEAPVSALSRKNIKKNEPDNLSPLAESLDTGRGPLYSSIFGDRPKNTKEILNSDEKRSIFDSKMSYISDNTPNKSELKGGAYQEQTLLSNEKDLLEGLQQRSAEKDQYRTLTMEKISNIKELSREIYPDISHLSSKEEAKDLFSDRRISPRLILGPSPRDISPQTLLEMKTEGDISSNPLMNTKYSEGYFSLKSTDRFLESVSDRNRTIGLDLRSTQTKPPLTKFTFERSLKERPDPEAVMALKLNSSFTLGRHPKLTQEGGDVSFTKDKGRVSRSPSVKSSPDKMTGPPRRSRLREVHGSNDSSRFPSPLLSQKSSKINSPKSLKEIKSTSFTPTNLGESEFELRNRSPTQLEKQVKELLDKNAALKMKLRKQGQALNKYQDSANTIKQLQNQINTLQSQLLQSEISYQTKINLLKQQHEKFLPNFANNISPDLHAILAQKDKTIEDLQKMISNLKRDKVELEGHVRELGTQLTSRESEPPITTDPKHMDNYITKLEGEIKYLKMQMSQSPHQAEQMKFGQYLNLFSSRAGRTLINFYTTLRNLKSRVFGRKKNEVIHTVEELLDIIDKNSTENEKDSPVPTAFLDRLIENCVSLSQIVGSGLWREAEKLTMETEDMIVQEFSKVEVSTSGSRENAPLSEESMFLISRSHTERDQVPKKSLREGKHVQLVVPSQTKRTEQKIAFKPVTEDIFLSDYSDEEFDIEDSEEKICIDFVCKLKEFFEETKTGEREIKKSWETHYDESLEDVQEVPPAKFIALLVGSGLTSTFQEFLSLFHRTETVNTKNGMLGWKQFMSTIRSKNLLWWKNKIHNSSFDLKYKSWNLGHFLNEENGLRPIIFEGIASKLSFYFKNNDISLKMSHFHDYFQNDFITKKQLRKLFLSHKIPFTKFETQVVTFMLDPETQNKIDFEDFKSFVENLDLTPFYQRYMSARGKQLQQEKAPNASLNTIMLAIRETLQQYKEPSQVQIKDVFKLKDSRFSGLMTYNQFFDCCMEAEIPFNDVDDIKVVFDGLSKKLSNNTSNPNNFVISYQRFLDLLFDQPTDTGRLSTVTNILEERDLKYQILMLENQLKEYQNRITELEEEMASYKNKPTKGDASILVDDKENISFLANAHNQNKSVLADKARTKTAKTYLFSTERTLKLKVEDLEYENATLRKKLQEHQVKIEGLETKRKEYEETFRKNEEIKVNGGLEISTLRNLESKLENMEKTYILREVDLKNDLTRLRRTKEEEIEIMKRQFVHEREEFKKVVEGKNKEINEFRIELEGILNEMANMKHYQAKFGQNELQQQK